MSAQADLSFKLLSLLSKERAVYGLRNGDHERYRKHCSNKVHRLRQVSSLTCGKGKVFKKPPPVTAESVKDTRQLHLLLFSAERALAHSHALKSLGSKASHPPNTRRDQLSWLKRALAFSTALHSVASTLASGSPARLDQRTLTEITIYHLSLLSEYEFERSLFAECLTSLAARRKLLTTIADASTSSYDQALAHEFIDAHDPLIRFCAYKLGRSESHDIEGVVRDVDGEMMEEKVPGFGKLLEGLKGEMGAEDVEMGRKGVGEIVFAGERVEMRNAEMVGVMGKVVDAVGRLGKADGKDGAKGRGMKGWDRVLGVLGEAEGVARRLLEDHEASGSSTSLRSTKTTESLSLSHQYIVYLLLSHRIRRDLLLVDTLLSTTPLPSEASSFRVPGGRAKLEEAVKGLAAVIKLYDTVMQSLGQIRGLQVVEEKDGLRLAVEGLEGYCHATRCFYLARLHCIHPTPSYASAVQLLALTPPLLSQARSNLLSPPVALQEEIITLSPSQLDTLSVQIGALELAAKRALFAERLSKPVFFDTAFNYIDLPMDDLLVKAGKAPEPTDQAAGAGIVDKMEGVVEEGVKEIKKAVGAVQMGGRERTTRESTPAVGERNEGEQQAGKKGWLGGWFGRG